MRSRFTSILLLFSFWLNAAPIMADPSSGGASTVTLSKINALASPGSLTAGNLTTTNNVTVGGSLKLTSTGGTGHLLRQATAGGVVTSGVLTAGDIPSLPASQITSGTLATARIGSGTPTAGYYVDGGTGAWTVLPSGGGGNSNVSADNITAGTLAIPLNLGNSNSLTAGNNSVAGTSTGVKINSVSGNTTQVQVNGATQTTFGLGGIISFANAAGAKSSLIAIVSAFANQMTLCVPSGGVYDFNVAGTTVMQAGPGGITYIGSGQATLDASRLQAVSDASNQISLQVPTGGTVNVKVNGVNQATVGTSGIALPTSQSASSSAVGISNYNGPNLLCNAPSSGAVVLSQSGVGVASFGGSATTFGGNRWALGTYATGTVNGANPGMYSDGQGIYSNAITGYTNQLLVNNVAILTASGGAITASTPITLKAYTVSGLPSGVVGMTAYVTDATSPTYNGSLTGGGSTKIPVFYNGSAWVSH